MNNPKNEMGVIVLFSQICENLGWEIVSVQTRFPDGCIRNKETRKEYRVEFEFLASNFIFHEHDVFGCDVLICWENDLDYIPLTVWELSKHAFPNVELFGNGEKELFKLKIENKQLKKDNVALLARIEYLAVLEEEDELGKKEKEDVCFEILTEFISKNGFILTVRELVQLALSEGVSLSVGKSSYIINDFILKNQEKLLSLDIVDLEKVQRAALSVQQRQSENLKQDWRKVRPFLSDQELKTIAHEWTPSQISAHYKLPSDGRCARNWKQYAQNELQMQENSYQQ